MLNYQRGIIGFSWVFLLTLPLLGDAMIVTSNLGKINAGAFPWHPQAMIGMGNAEYPQKCRHRTRKTGFEQDFAGLLPLWDSILRFSHGLPVTRNRDLSQNPREASMSSGSLILTPRTNDGMTAAGNQLL